MPKAQMRAGLEFHIIMEWEEDPTEAQIIHLEGSRAQELLDRVLSDPPRIYHPLGGPHRASNWFYWLYYLQGLDMRLEFAGEVPEVPERELEIPGGAVA